MNDEIRVSVQSWGDNRNLLLVWKDPARGLQRTKTAGTKDWKAAERKAGKLADQLQFGEASLAPVSWDEFTARFDREKLAGLRPKTRKAYLGSLKRFRVDWLARLTSGAVSQAVAVLRAEGMLDSTLAHHLRHLKAATRWAARIGILKHAPEIDMPKRKGQAKSRAVTGEEYDRMIVAAGRVRKRDAATWIRYLEGLWLSGLRRSEALRLTWGDGTFRVSLSGKRPVFVIEGAGQKSGKAEVCPMAPDFAQFLLRTPASHREGRVFQIDLSENRVGRIVEQIGRKAGVKVGGTEEKPIFAGCHSLRRSFGSRWAKRVSPSVLKRLMRHSSIATTEAYYVHLDAEEISDELWGLVVNHEALVQEAPV